MPLAFCLAMACASGGGERLPSRAPAGLRTVVLDPRNVLVRAEGPIAGVRIAGLREGLDYLVFPAERPTEVRVRLLADRSPLRIEALPPRGTPLGAATIPNPRVPAP